MAATRSWRRSPPPSRRRAEDVSRAVTAAGLLRERRLVLTRLRHLGVHVIEAPAAETGPALVNAYLDFKRRSLL